MPMFAYRGSGAELRLRYWGKKRVAALDWGKNRYPTKKKNL